MIITKITELKNFVEVNSTNLDNFKPSLRAAERRHLAPVLGANQYQELVAAYNLSVAQNPTVPGGKMRQLLELAQEAVANIGLAFSVSRLAVEISGAGVRRSESDTMKSAFQYQETNLREALSQAGFDVLEDMLAFLEANKGDFAAWADSDAFRDYKTYFITSGIEFTRFYDLKQSRLAYMSLRSIMRKIEQFMVRDITGKELFASLKAGQLANNLLPAYTSLLDDFIRPGIAHYTIATGLLQHLIQVNENGVTVSLLSNDRNTQVREQPGLDKIQAMVDALTATGDEYFKRLSEELAANPDLYPDYTAPNAASELAKIINKQENGVYGV